MGGEAPGLIITDEARSIKNAIAIVFPGIIHRLCMWHIMDKLPEKVGPVIREEPEFWKRMNACVWGSETPAEFESEWNSVISDFSSEDNEWFTKRFSLRESWIPAYFMDISLAGILRTTSRSESANSFFNRFIHRKLTLVEFWLRFDTALECQRQEELIADNSSIHRTPQLVTPWEIEKQGSEVFTYEVFEKFQKQIIAARDHCCVQSITQDEGIKIVTFRTGASKIREVMRMENQQELPTFYIMERWQKRCKRESVYDVQGNLLEEKPADCLDAAARKKISTVRNKLEDLIQTAKQSDEGMNFLLSSVLSIEEPLRQKVPAAVKHTRQEEYEAFIGCNIPNEINIHPPNDVRSDLIVRLRLSGCTDARSSRIHKIRRPKRNKNCGFLTRRKSRLSQSFRQTQAPPTDTCLAFDRQWRQTGNETSPPGAWGRRVRSAQDQEAATMATPLDTSSSILWGTLSQASSVAQLVGVDALGLVSMVVQAALAARRHRDACVRLAQHVELVGGLLGELELAELMRREATRRPLEQLGAVLRRCYALVSACQDCGYLRRLLLGARMADELRAAQHEIDMFIRLIPLIALVDNSTDNRRVKADEMVVRVVTDSSNRHIRFSTRTLEFTEARVQRGTELCNVGDQPFAGIADLQEQKVFDIEELVELCTSIEEACVGFSKFSFFQIVDVTDNFSEKAIIGCGGFGTVYKGQLPDGVMVAIKRLDEHATIFDFKSELQLAKLQHTNLVRLLGWCIHGKERILVYTLIQNGSLNRYISDITKRPLLDWSKRLKIITGLTEGLVYLHKGSMFWIVHRDLKPHNILLDCNMNPKITDFGSARVLSSYAAEEHTSRVVGTCGYKAPEYASRGVYSMKTDVFSFGVLVLVIISGRKNTILDKRGDTVGDLVRDAWHMWKELRLHELVDRTLGNRYDMAEITRCAQVALICAQEDPSDRPTMTDVAAMLNSESMSLPMEPKMPTALSKGGPGEDAVSTYMGQTSRTIDITITSSAPMSTRVQIILDPEV
ncbi:hypothetical protein ACQ4PT_064853 [Festuca glaucescens]